MRRIDLLQPYLLVWGLNIQAPSRTCQKLQERAPERDYQNRWAAFCPPSASHHDDAV